jgi:hypothetical protein
MRSLVFVLITKHYGGQVKDDEVGGGCSTNGRDERCKQSVAGGGGRKETTFRALGVDYRIILKEILKK